MKMKRKITVIILVLIMLLSFSGCEKKNEQDDLPPEKGTADLNVVFNVSGKSIMNYGSGNDKGYYDIVPRMWDISEQLSSGELDSNIVYIDYASQARVYLCQDPSCRHDNENCTSFIRSASSLAVFPALDQLFYVQFGNSLAESQLDLPAIVSMDTNGTNRRTLCTLEPSESFSAPLIFVSDNISLFFQVTEIDQNDGSQNKYLKRINTKTGAYETEVEIPSTYILSSAYDEYLIFYDYNSSSNYAYSVSQKRFEKRTTGISGIYNGSRSVDLKYDIDINGDYTRIKQTQSIDILINDMKDNTIKTLGTYSLEEGHNIVGLSDIYNDHVVLSYAVNNADSSITNVSYMIDLSTGDCTKNTLYASGNEDIPVSIIANTSELILTVIGYKQASSTFYDRQGIAHTVDYVEAPIYAVIKPEDYYSNNPAYTMIIDNVLSYETN